MDFHKLNPWNWFKHEESKQQESSIVPVKREQYNQAQYPLANLSHLHNEIDRMFENAFRGFGLPSLSRSNRWEQMFSDDFLPAFRANVNIASDDKQYTITLEAPGMEQKDLSIELKDRVLVVKGNKQQQQEEKDKQYYRIERHYGAFERVLAVPDDADVDEINARMDKGLLTITIPRKKVAETDVKKIDIQGS